MILFIIVISLFFAIISLAPVLLAGDPDAKKCILWRR